MVKHYIKVHFYEKETFLTKAAYLFLTFLYNIGYKGTCSLSLIWLTHFVTCSISYKCHWIAVWKLSVLFKKFPAYSLFVPSCPIFSWFVLEFPEKWYLCRKVSPRSRKNQRSLSVSSRGSGSKKCQYQRH